MTNYRKKADEAADKLMRWDVPEGVPYTLPESIAAKRNFFSGIILDATIAAHNEGVGKSADVAEKQNGTIPSWKMRHAVMSLKLSEGGENA